MKLQINRKIRGKSPNAWKLSNTLLNNPLVKEKVTSSVRKYFELNEMKMQNVWDKTKVILKWKIRALNTYNRRKISNQLLNFYLKKLANRGKVSLKEAKNKKERVKIRD